jgi:hypothetical protein
MPADRSLPELKAALDESSRRLQYHIDSRAASLIPESVAFDVASELTRTVLPTLQELITEVEELRGRAGQTAQG